MSGSACGDEFGEFLHHFSWLPPEDQRFLKRLMVELARRAEAADAMPAGDRILLVTREIAPDRVRWVADRLGC